MTYIDVRGSDRTEMTSCITGANIKTDQWTVKRYSGRKGHSATKSNLPRAYRVASQETEERNPISSPSALSHLNTKVFKSSKMTCRHISLTGSGARGVLMLKAGRSTRPFLNMSFLLCFPPKLGHIM